MPAEPTLFDELSRRTPAVTTIEVAEDFDPFGPDTVQPRKFGGREDDHSLPDQRGIREVFEHGTPEEGRGRKPKKKQTNHTQRTIEYWEALGYICTPCDGWMMVNGLSVRKDFMGLWDFMCSQPGKPVTYVQVCAKGDESKHFAKVFSDKPAPDNKRQRLANLRHCLSCGYRCVMMLFSQPGGAGTKWAIDLIEITEDEIELRLGRRRKK